MKLHLADAPGKNLFTGYGEGYVLINGKRYEGNLLVLPGKIEPWKGGGVETLTADDFSHLSTLGMEIVLLGTGKRQHFPSPALAAVLPAAGIGLEVMDNGAACRTYNILVAEGREVAALLL